MKQELRKELDALKSSLANEKFKSTYEVPDDFFDTMQQKVIQKMDASQTGGSSVFHFRKWIYASAAIFILAIGAWVVFDLQSSSKSGFEALETEAIYAYLDENLDEFSLNMLMSGEQSIEPFLLETVSTEQMEDYLEDNLDELSLEALEELL